jgi:hypothetical protein
LEHLVKGGTVVTNIEFYPDKIAEWMHREHGLEFDPSRLIRIEDGKDVWEKAVKGDDVLPAMMVVDEAHVEHNARDFAKTSPQQILFNTMVRKLSIHMIYITQDMNNIDKQFRRMVQLMWYCRNARHMKVFGIIPFPLPLFFRVPYVCGPGVPPKAMKPEITLRPISWGLFDSRALVGKAAATFGVLAAAKTSPLRRIKRPVTPIRWHVWIPVMCGILEFIT